MRAAIDVLVSSGAAADAVLVIGDMGEVGAQSEALHAEVGAYAAQQGVGRLFAVGWPVQGRRSLLIKASAGVRHSILDHRKTWCWR